MANYRFTRHYKSEPEKLNRLDELLCEELGLEPDAENFCWLYRWLEEIGFAVLMSQGGSSVTEAAYKEWRKTTKITENEVFIQNERLIKKYLYGEYSFTAWR